MPASVRSRIRASALAIAAALLVAPLIPLGAQSAAADEAAWAVDGGSVTWGVKESLRNYVPGGGEAQDGAIKLDTGEFELPIASGGYDSGTRDLHLELDGTIVFDHRAHTFGFTFSDLAIDITAASSTLSAEVTSTFYDQGTGETVSETSGRASLVTLDTRHGVREVEPGAYTWTGIPTALTSAGADLFEATIDGASSRFYSEGTAFDALGIRATGEQWPEEGYVEPTWTEPGAEVLTAVGATEGYTFYSALGVREDRARGALFAAATEADGTYSIAVLDASSLDERQRLALPGNPAVMAVDERSGRLVVSSVDPSSTSIGWLSVLEPDGDGAYSIASTRAATLSSLTFQPFFDTEGRFVIASRTLVDRQFGLLFFEVDELDEATPLVPEYVPFGAYATYGGVQDPATGLIHLTATTAAGGVITVDPSGARAASRVALTGAGGASSAILLVDGKLLVSRTTVLEVLALGDDGLPVKDRSVATGWVGSMAYDAVAGVLYAEAVGTGAVRTFDVRDDLTERSVRIDGLIASNQPGSSRLLLSGRGAEPPLVTVYSPGSVAAPVVVSRLVTIARSTTPAVSTQPSDTVAELQGAQYSPDGALIGAQPQDVVLTAAAGGAPAPEVRWQMETAYGWDDLSDDDVFRGTGTGELTIAASEALDGVRFRAVFTSGLEDSAGDRVTIGRIASAPATLRVTIAEPEVEAPTDGGVVGEGGAVAGEPNAAGASTTVTPGVELARDGATALQVDGSGFTRNTNASGAYVLFGYVTRYPSAGGSAGNGYDYIPGGGASGQDGQVYVAWPENSATGGAATAVFDSSTDGGFSAAGLSARASFRGQSGATVDCLDGSVQCGVLTIGAHGGRDAALETFTPVSFEGQDPGLPGTAPVLSSSPSDATATEGATASFAAGATGWPVPTVQWQRSEAGADAWVDVPGATAAAYTTAALQRSDSGARYRAVFTNAEGSVASDAATLTVMARGTEPGGGTPGAPDVQEDGSIIGEPNAAGAYLQARPGVELDAAGTTLSVEGSGFTRNSNRSGVYVLFGYLATAPSEGGSAGRGYDFNPGGGDSGQEGQLFVSWPDNGQTGSAANATFSATTDGGFTASGLLASARFTGQSGATVDCLDGTVVCGVITIGAHGGADAALETFTPVFFAGQEVPTAPVVIPEPPTAPTTPVVQAPSVTVPAVGVVEGSLVWGVKSSFRSYITGSIAKGAISVSGGAATEGGLFRFGQRSTDWSAGSTSSSTGYAGAVRFTGHSGILDLSFANPVVRIDSASSGTLLVDVNGARSAIGSLDLAAAGRSEVSGGVAYSNVPVTLTAAGASAFSYGESRFYPAGTAMDPLSFVVGGTAVSGAGGGGGAQAVAAYQDSSWTAPAEPPASTGLQIDPEQLENLRPGSEITVTGEGYDADESDIKVVLYSEPVVLENALSADAGGTAAWTGIIPLDTEPGEHTLTFQGSQDLGIVLTVLEPVQPSGCTVRDATLRWGFKETFRSYISGSIAHGEWQVSDGASYETPEFGWSAGTGVLDAEATTGEIAFAGSIRFTGHDGLLDTTVANPTIVLTGPDRATLLLDVAGVTMDEALAGGTTAQVAEQVPFVDIDLASAVVERSEDGTTLTVTDAPTAITAQGYEAFPNYEPGTAFDAIGFTITTDADCAVVPVEEEEDAVAVAAVPAAGDGADLAWIGWTAGGALVAGALALVLVLVLRRRRAEAESAAAAPEV